VLGQPLSFGQQRLWFLDRLVPNTALYNMTQALHIGGALNRPALERSLATIIERHESLRTTFHMDADEPYQVVAAKLAIPLPYNDLRDEDEAERDQAALAIANAETRRAFDLSKGPLLRVRIVQLSDDASILFSTMHHIITDGWSMGVYCRELTALYNAYCDARPSPLLPLPIQYIDFAVWQRQRLNPPLLDGLISYWRDKLADLPQLRLPSDRPRPELSSYRGATCSIALPESLWQALKQLSQEQGVTPFMTLFSAFNVLLARFSGQQDLVVGTPIAGRDRAELEGLIGFFVNTLVLRTDLTGNPSFLEALQRVREMTLEAYAHQELPFEKLVDSLRPERDLGRNPLFEVMFQLQNVPGLRPTKASQAVRRSMEIERAMANFDLALDMREGATGLEGHLEYSSDLFDEATAQRMLEAYGHLLEAIVANPEEHIQDLPLLSSQQRNDLLWKWNSTSSKLTEACVHNLFEQQLERNPGFIALVDGERCLSYQEVDQLAARLAHKLQALGVGPDMVVAVHAEPCVETLIALLAIGKAGGAFAPIDPAYPLARQDQLLRICAPGLVLSHSHLHDKLPDLGVKTLLLDDAYGDGPSDFKRNSANPDDLAYVIHTSGSTGQPKGVEISHRALVNHNLAMAEQLQIRPSDRVLQLATLGFDVALEEIFPTWAAGATVVLRPQQGPLTPAQLLELVEHQNITVLNMPTPYWHEWIKQLPDGNLPLPKSLRLVVIGSERATPSDVSLWLEKMGSKPALLHAYGLSETTITCLVQPVPGDPCWRHPQAELPVGFPLANCYADVVDSRGNPTPLGVVGDLLIGGMALARGYRGASAQKSSAAVFEPDQWRPGQRVLRTGDRARRLADGAIELLGRSDDQLKLRGFRIEPAEIEGLLLRHPAVAEAAAVMRTDPSGERRLVAYVVAHLSSANAKNKGWNYEQLDHWRSLYDEIYSQPAPHADLTFNTIGWDSTYSGEPLSADAMREQVDGMVARLQSLRAKRVLEIGCGTGLLLFPLAPICERYTGTDVSTTALESLRQAIASDQNLSHVLLRQQAAHDFSGLEAGGFDLVLINSVVQYFPDVHYLERVMRGAWSLLAPGGSLVIGDVRHRQLQTALYSSVELHRAAAEDSARLIAERARQRVQQEMELVLDPAFFESLAATLPQARSVDIALKRGYQHNELTRFRYDVILNRSPEAAPDRVVITTLPLDWRQEGCTLHWLEEQLGRQKPLALFLHAVPNRRLQGVADLLEFLEGPRADPTSLQQRRERLNAPAEGLEPEDLWDLAKRYPYSVSITWSDQPGCFDVQICRQGLNAQTGFTRSPTMAPVVGSSDWDGTPYANDPHQGFFARRLVPQLRSWVKDRLPDYMLPGAFVVLPRLPRTAAGKLDRQALPAPESSRPGVESTYVAPRSALEASLAAIWSELLGLARVGVHDNFFELGGDSILTIQVMARAQQAGLQLTPRQLFQHQTIAQLASVAGHEAQAQPQPEPELTAGPVPLTPIQQWFFEQRLPSPHHNNQAMLLRLRQPLHVADLKTALGQLLRHHDGLRLRFGSDPSSPDTTKQTLVDFDGNVPFTEVDLSQRTRSSWDEAIEHGCRQAQVSLDLRHGPLTRFVLFQRGDGAPQLLLLVVHHLVVDGVSWRVLLDDLATAISQLRGGNEVRLPAQSTSFASWAKRLMDFAGSDSLQQELDYWLSTVKDRAPVPLDAPQGPNDEGSAQRVWSDLNRQDTERLLRDLPRRYHTGINDVLLTAMTLAYGQWSGQPGLLLDLEGHGREPLFDDVDLSRTVGWFTTMYPVWLTADPSHSPATTLKGVRDQLKRVPRKGIGYGLLRYGGDGERAQSLSSLPQPQVMFNYMGQLDRSSSEASPWAICRHGSGPNRSPEQPRSHILEVNGAVVEGCLEVSFSYGNQIHRRDSITKLADHFVAALKRLLDDSADGPATTPETYDSADFPLAGLNQKQLDQLVQKLNQPKNPRS
jgi:amino acid adenylation domain-containing protein/non-ribosomal peptide synthase protein (TIGR01720 family)